MAGHAGFHARAIQIVPYGVMKGPALGDLMLQPLARVPAREAVTVRALKLCCRVRVKSRVMDRPRVFCVPFSVALLTISGTYGLAHDVALQPAVSRKKAFVLPEVPPRGFS